MESCGAVTILAAMLRDAAFLVGLVPVRGALPGVVLVRVAGLAGFRTRVLSLVGVFRGRYSGSRFIRIALRGLSFLCPHGSQLHAKQNESRDHYPAESLRAPHWTPPSIHFNQPQVNMQYFSPGLSTTKIWFWL